LLPLVVYPPIRQTLKVVFECPSRSFWQVLRPANSPWGLPLRRRWPPHPVWFGPWPWPWPWPRRVKPRPTVGEVYRRPSSFNCLPLPLGWLRMRCPPLPQPQHTGVRLPTTAVGDLVGHSAVDCWHRCLISASSSRTKLVVKLVSLSAAAVAPCTAELADDADTSSALLYCRPRSARTVGLEIGIPKPESLLHSLKLSYQQVFFQP